MRENFDKKYSNRKQFIEISKIYTSSSGCPSYQPDNGDGKYRIRDKKIENHVLAPLHPFFLRGIRKQIPYIIYLPKMLNMSIYLLPVLSLLVLCTLLHSVSHIFSLVLGRELSGETHTHILPQRYRNYTAGHPKRRKWLTIYKHSINI